ncbi:MAG: DUF1295 domain-containing protein [Bacteroidota bacterium]|jgi:3-oxo-5-alpha-steroid 4-dehydrogenase 1|nr:DUF1295 domain-containing protein [Bacteroidota bacterium]
MQGLILNLQQFNGLLIIMAIIALFVFIALHYVEAGYGKMISPKWGVAINNKLAWILMECPVFFVLLYIWSQSPRQWDTVPLIFFLLFELHYFQRAFIFPFLLKGKSKMPLSIMAMGILFNTINGYIQGEWIFFLAPEDMYTIDWLTTPQFIIGTIIFFIGMGINFNSDHVIRNLRAPGDTKHYLPKKNMYRYVTSANYFGEIVEWTGFAILTWSLPGLIFVLWTCANLVPRANSIYHKYKKEFGDEFNERKLKRIFPFIY